MKKKSDTARECAEQLKPLGKTIEDATDFYVRHLQRKKSTGRPPGTGALSGITSRMEWADIRKRIRNPAFEAGGRQFESKIGARQFRAKVVDLLETADRKSTRLNSS